MSANPKTRPDFRAYSVIEREGEKSFWLDVGAGFVHSDGNGINVILQALPIDGKVVLRDFAESERIKSAHTPSA